MGRALALVPDGYTRDDFDRDKQWVTETIAERNRLASKTTDFEQRNSVELARRLHRMRNHEDYWVGPGVTASDRAFYDYLIFEKVVPLEGGGSASKRYASDLLQSGRALELLDQHKNSARNSVRNFPDPVGAGQVRALGSAFFRHHPDGPKAAANVWLAAVEEKDGAQPGMDTVTQRARVYKHTYERTQSGASARRAERLGARLNKLRQQILTLAEQDNNMIAVDDWLRGMLRETHKRLGIK